MTAGREPDSSLLGAVLVGGRSRRFGSRKARAELAGLPLAAHSRDRLLPHVSRVVLVGGDVELGRALGLEVHSDAEPGLGPLGGLAAALSLADREGKGGVLVLACDTPLVAPGLVRELVGEWNGKNVVLPESDGPSGVEPLCGIYPVGVRGAVQAALGSGDRSMAALVESLAVKRLPLERVRRHGDPRDLFLNVNRPADLERAEALLRGHEGP